LAYESIVTDIDAFAMVGPCSRESEHQDC